MGQGDTKIIRSKKNSILLRVLIIVGILCGVQIIYSSSILYGGWIDYNKAKKLKDIQYITYHFTDGLRDFMFERGRMNVLLAGKDTISSDNVIFIQERRKAADAAFEEGLYKMKDDYPLETLTIEKEFNQIKDLRKDMDLEVLIPLSGRDSMDRTLWYSKCTDYINLISETMKKIGSTSLGNDLISHYQVLIIETLQFRSIVGNESSVFTSAIAENKKISKEDYASLLTMRGKSKQLWSEIENEIDELNSSKLKDALNTVEEKYYKQFRPDQDKLLELTLANQIYNGAAEEIAKLSVPALDSIFALADTAKQEIALENQKNMKKAYLSLIKGMLQLLFSIFIIFFIPAYLKKKLIQPLNNIVQLIECLRLEKTDIRIVYDKRNDEIGKLAKGVAMLQKSIEEERLLKEELQQAIENLKLLSITDALTGLYNRRYIIEKMNELEVSYKRNKGPFSIIMCDIDKFKTINDIYGHNCGDYALINTAKVIYECCREQDFLSRWGGEEFLILLPDTSRDGACVLAERIRKMLEDKSFKYENHDLKITMTFGVSEHNEAIGMDVSIKNADMALIEGKNQGRNRVVVI